MANLLIKEGYLVPTLVLPFPRTVGVTDRVLTLNLSLPTGGVAYGIPLYANTGLWRGSTYSCT